MGDFLLLTIGLAGLWLGSETLIRGAMSLADRYRWSDALFGMLVLAVGTDLPELFVAFDASVRSLAGEDLSGIVIGSAIGSTIGQFALVFGVAGFLGFPPMQRKFLPRNITFLLGSIVAVFVFSSDGLITRTEGVLLCAYYAAYLFVLIFRRVEIHGDGDHSANTEVWKAWLILFIGLGLLLVAAELTVKSATSFRGGSGLKQYRGVRCYYWHGQQSAGAVRVIRCIVTKTRRPFSRQSRRKQRARYVTCSRIGCDHFATRCSRGHIVG